MILATSFTYSPWQRVSHTERDEFSTSICPVFFCQVKSKNRKENRGKPLRLYSSRIRRKTKLAHDALHAMITKNVVLYLETSRLYCLKTSLHRKNVNLYCKCDLYHKNPDPKCDLYSYIDNLCDLYSYNCDLYHTKSIYINNNVRKRDFVREFDIFPLGSIVLYHKHFLILFVN